MPQSFPKSLFHDQELHHAGAPLDQAKLVVIAGHGRYGAAGDILKLAEQVDRPKIGWIAPQAAGGSWWEESFLAPLSANAAGLAKAQARLSTLVEDLADQGFGPERIVLAGFSQGACLMLEYAASNAKPLRGVVAMSGGLIGTAEGDGPPCDTLYGYAPKRFDYTGNLTGVPVHIGCHIQDPVIPIARVRHSAKILETLGAQVALEAHPGKMHGVLHSDIAALQKLLSVEQGEPNTSPH